MLRPGASNAPAAPSAANPSPRPVLKAAAAALLVLFRLSTYAALCAFLAAFCSCSLGIAIHVLGRRICGEGSAVEEAGWAILVRAIGLLPPLFPALLLLVMNRLYEHVMFIVEEETDKKQYPPPSAASHLGKAKLATVYMLPFAALAILAMWMKVYAEKGSPEWRVGSVLFDSAMLGGSFVAGFLVVLVPNMVILGMHRRAKGMQ